MKALADFAKSFAKPVLELGLNVGWVMAVTAQAILLGPPKAAPQPPGDGRKLPTMVHA